MTIIETIKTRKSCRTYCNRAIEPEKLAELRQFLASNTKTPFGSKVRFHLIDFNEMEIGELKNLTTYGVIKGARQFIVGTVEKQPRAMEDYGYCMERNILKATSMGLGTCLLGGTFKRSGFADKISIHEGELLPVISPVGYPRDKRSVVDRMFRMFASSDKRKPWHELFYLHGIDTFLDKENSGRFDTPLECVRMAPSALNKQPWRVIKAKMPFIFISKGHRDMRILSKISSSRTLIWVLPCVILICRQESLGLQEIGMSTILKSNHTVWNI